MDPTSFQRRTTTKAHVSPSSRANKPQLTLYRCSEDLNSLVKKHIQTVISSTPSKALAMLEKDATELIEHGMMTLNAKLSGIEDEKKLVHRVVEVWGFFWDQVLPYVEGVSYKLYLRNHRH